MRVLWISLCAASLLIKWSRLLFNEQTRFCWRGVSLSDAFGLYIVWHAYHLDSFFHLAVCVGLQGAP